MRAPSKIGHAPTRLDLARMPGSWLQFFCIEDSLSADLRRAWASGLVLVVPTVQRREPAGVVEFLGRVSGDSGRTTVRARSEADLMGGGIGERDRGRECLVVGSRPPPL